ncbi:MAG: hypothetical protein ACREH3_13375 [Geminicoccales bacterium]
MKLSIRFAGRVLVAALVAAAIAGCAAPKRATRSAPADRPTASDSGPPPHISKCREYADTMAGRQMERDFDSISGNFEGGNSQVFQDFARLDAKRYYQQLYEACLSQHRASEPASTAR